MELKAILELYKCDTIEQAFLFAAQACNLLHMATILEKKLNFNINVQEADSRKTALMLVLESDSDFEIKCAAVLWLLKQNVSLALQDKHGKTALDYLGSEVTSPEKQTYLKEAFKIAQYNLNISDKLSRLLKKIKEAGGVKIERRPIIQAEVHIDPSTHHLTIESIPKLIENRYTTLCLERSHNETLLSHIKENEGELKSQKEKEKTLFAELYEDSDNQDKVSDRAWILKKDAALLDHGTMISVPFFKSLLQSGLKVKFIEPTSDGIDHRHACDKSISELRDIGLFTGFAISILENMKSGSMLITGAAHVPGICKLFSEHFKDVPEIQPVIVYPFSTSLPHQFLKMAVQNQLVNTKSALELLSLTNVVHVLDMSSARKKQDGLRCFSEILKNKPSSLVLRARDFGEELMPLSKADPQYVQLFSVNVLEESEEGTHRTSSVYKRSFRTKIGFQDGLQRNSESLLHLYNYHQRSKSRFGDMQVTFDMQYSIQRVNVSERLNAGSAITEPSPIFTIQYKARKFPSPAKVNRLFRNAMQLPFSVDPHEIAPVSVPRPLLLSGPAKPKAQDESFEQVRKREAKGGNSAAAKPKHS